MKRASRHLTCEALLCSILMLAAPGFALAQSVTPLPPGTPLKMPVSPQSRETDKLPRTITSSGEELKGATTTRPTTPSPETGAAPETGKKPEKPADSENQSPPAASALQPFDTEPPGPLPHIALIVPTESTAFGPGASALKQGFATAAKVAGEDAPPWHTYRVSDEASALKAAYQRAVSLGAIAVVGALTRDGADLLARETSNVPTLALNAPAKPLKRRAEAFYFVSLGLDNEARLVARAAFGEGLRKMSTIATASAISRRILENFEQEWLALGGKLAARLTIPAEPTDFKAVQKLLDKADGDAVFIAADIPVVRAWRPYLPTLIPVYATSFSLDARAPAIDNVDLEAMRFLEMPWLAEPDHPAVMSFPQPPTALPIDYERLYALGIDAWRLAELMLRRENAKTPIEDEALSLDGVIGRLSLNNGQFMRRLGVIEVRDGQIRPFKPE